MEQALKTFETKLQAGEGERSVIARISTTAVDRDGDVMLPSGADLRDFRQNPVVLFGHQQDRIPVAKATRIERTPHALLAKIEFAPRPESLPDVQEWVPDTLHHLFKEGVLNAFSVGFMIDEAIPAERKHERRYGPGVKRIITEWRLLEFSVVPVPANQDALAMAVSKGFCSSGSWTHKIIADEFGPLSWNTPLPFVLDDPADEPEKIVLGL